MSLGNLVQDASSAYGIYQGLSRGGIGGDIQAAANAGKLVNNVFGKGTVPTSVTNTLGAAADAYNIYSAFQHPTVGSVAGGVASAADLYNKVAPSLGGEAIGGAAGKAVPYVGTALSAYNSVKDPSPENLAALAGSIGSLASIPGAGPFAAGSAIMFAWGDALSHIQAQAELNKGAGPGTGWMGNYKGIDLYSNRPLNPYAASVWDEYMAMHANDPQTGPGTGPGGRTGSGTGAGNTKG